MFALSSASSKVSTFALSSLAEMRWLPTMAAAPASTGVEQAVSPRKLTPAAAAATATRIDFTCIPFRQKPQSAYRRQFEEHRLDQIAAPFEQIQVTQRLPAQRLRLGHRHQQRLGRLLVDRPLVEPVQPDLLRLAQPHRAELDELPLRRDVRQPRPARLDAEGGHLQQVLHLDRRRAVAV